jgi:tRNA G10  N-methylase Trm11
MSSSTARSHDQTASCLNGVRYSLHLTDCLAWMDRQSANSVHAIVTDPPYGLKEYTAPEKQKLRRGKGGVWRYTIDQTESLKPGRTVALWRVDVCYLRKRNWKYEKSKAGAGRGGRTHTFGVREPAKRLKSAIVCQAPNVVVKKGRPVLRDGGE